MSSAFAEPPDSGVNVSASVAGAAARRASSAAASAASIRRRGMPVGKARGSYPRPMRTLYFVPVAPSGLLGGAQGAPALGFDLELAHAQAVDLELADAQLLDHRLADRQPADGDRAERDRAQGDRADGLGADRAGADRARAGHAHAPRKAGSRFSRNARAPSWKSRVRARPCCSSASSESWPSRLG